MGMVPELPVAMLGRTALEAIAEDDDRKHIEADLDELSL